MTPFELAMVPQSEREATYRSVLAAWEQGNRTVRMSFTASDLKTAKRDIKAFLRKAAADKYYRNDIYQVAITEMGDYVRLSIKRIDRQIIHDWRELQEIKNQLLGREREAVELYPAEGRLVDTANQYYLFALKDPTFRFPFGFDNGRHISVDAIHKSVNRPFA